MATVKLSRTASIGPWPSMASLEALARHHEFGGWEPIGFHLSFWWGVVVLAIWVWINTYENTITIVGYSHPFMYQLFWCEQSRGTYGFWHTAMFFFDKKWKWTVGWWPHHGRLSGPGCLGNREPSAALHWSQQKVRHSETRSFNVVYPLVNVYITVERSTIFNGKIHYFYGHFQ